MRIRLWMSETEFNRLLNNSLPDLKFTTVACTFEKGLQMGDFGYGQITMKEGADMNIFSAISRGETTWGPP